MKLERLRYRLRRWSPDSPKKAWWFGVCMLGLIITIVLRMPILLGVMGCCGPAVTVYERDIMQRLLRLILDRPVPAAIVVAALAASVVLGLFQMRPLVLLGVTGCCGATLMFIADLILYLPSRTDMCTAQVYFDKIDPHGTKLMDTPMLELQDERMMLGGALGPIAAVLYSIGFTQLFFGLRPSEGAVGPALATVGLSTMMIVGGVYHAFFVYTAFIANAMRHQKNALYATPLTNSQRNLFHNMANNLLAKHQRYLLFIYRWAALPGLVGSAAFIFCCLTRETIYPRALAVLAPCFSAPLKIGLKRRRTGGLILCGGLTNLWNLMFLLAITVSAAKGDA